jgi:hypothetical protein
MLFLIVESILKAYSLRLRFMDYGVLGIGCNLDIWGNMTYEIAMWTNEEGIQFQIVVHN